MAVAKLKQVEASEQPLVRRPLEEILKVAREAGRDAVKDRVFFEIFGTEASYSWQEKTMPNSLGLSDDEFNDVTTKAETSYRDGMFEGCQHPASPANDTRPIGETRQAITPEIIRAVSCRIENMFHQFAAMSNLCDRNIELAIEQGNIPTLVILKGLLRSAARDAENCVEALSGSRLGYYADEFGAI